MKASLKFREEQKPLLRAKVPLNILGMPFQSGIVAGDSKELTLNLGTFFDSGPSVRLSYRPNDSFNPFSLVVKTGTGPFGSPLSSSMLMSCEFNLLSNRLTGNPNNVNSPLFMLHFKPRFGDFSFKKSQSSIFDKKGFVGGGVVVGGGGAGSDDDGSIEVVDSPAKVAAEIGGFGGYGGGGKVPILGGESPAAGAIAGMFSGMEVSARTTLPVRGRAALNFRWGVRVPAEIKAGEGKTTKEFAFRNVPFLVMDKIGIEHMVDGGGGGKSRNVKGNGNGELGFPKNGDVAEAFSTVKRQLEVLQGENGLLRNAVEDLRREIAGSSGGGGFQFGRNGMKGKNTDPRKSDKKSSDFNGFPGKSNEADASEELKKAFIGVTSA